MRTRRRGALVLAMGLAVSAPAAERSLHPYPLWPSTPVPGWPGLGADEGTTAETLTSKDHLGQILPGQYGQPEFVSYPGSVEHVRRELQRYVPPYPVYNANTLRKNFVLHQVPPYAARCVEWAEPVYYNPMYAPRVPTKQTRPPVKALPWKPGGEPIRLDLGRLEPSLYALRIIAAAPSQKAVRPKRYAFLQLRINDLPTDAAEMNAYVLRAQALDNFYAIQEFYFQARGDRAYRAELSLLPASQVELLVHNIDLHDRFAECARRRGKKRTALFDVDARHKLWEEMRAKYPKEADFKLRTPAEQRAFDDAVWRDAFPPLNAHTGQNLGTGKYDRANWHRDKWCPAPPEWEGLTLGGKPLCIRVGKGKLHLDTRGGIHTDLPRYEVRGGIAWWRNQQLGPVAEVSVKDGILRHKGRKVGEARHASVRGGELFQGGVPSGKAPRFYALPGTRTYDAQGRLALASELELKPGLYYDAERVTQAYRSAWRRDFVKQRRGLGAWHQLGNTQVARDEAMRFIRFVCQWPAVRPSRQLNFIMGACGLDRRYCRRYQWWPAHHELLTVYDSLFEFIDGNKPLAEAVGRYLPWVKTPDDVIQLIDRRLVQDYANDMMKYRYYYDHGQAKLMLAAVMVQDDRSISDPWMEFLWTRGWEYPQALSGLADNLVTSIGRDGGTNVGSIFYGIGGQLATIRLLEDYIKRGGNRKYDLTNPRQYPKSRQTIWLPFEASAAGRHVLGVGDVGGPSCAYGRIVHLANLRDIFATGWRWTRDPRFAYELARTFGRADEPETEWQKILAAARTSRDPYMRNRSRVLADWGGFLAGGADEDDFRFRRSLSVRVGNGHGHAHADTLDLRLWAHGVTMSGDLGQRPAYGRPRHQRSRVHNLVEVDGTDWNSHAWVPHLFDAPGAPYLVAESVAPYGLEHVTLFRRQCALIDADLGERSGRVPPQLDPDVVTPSCYVFDVFRVAGGTTHTYCFHGCVDDGFEVNVKRRKLMTGKEGDPDEDYLRGFRWRTTGKGVKPEDAEWAAEPAADTLVATWRLSRDPRTGPPEKRMYTGLGGKHGGAMTRPRKFTRLHLLGQTGSRVLHGIDLVKVGATWHNPSFPGYAGRCLFSQRRGEAGKALESAFVTLIEPYAGEPFIRATRRLRVEGNESDALRAVAVEVVTTGGHTDLCFADGRPDKLRTIQVTAGGTRQPVKVAGEYAYLSCDGGGLRQATITGGRLLDAAGVKIEIADVGHRGKVVAVDYLKRRVTVDAHIPARLFAGKWCEVGGAFHRTSFQVATIEHAGGRSVLTLRKGIEVMRSHVVASDPKAGRLRTAIAMLRFRGRDRELTASNEPLTKFWKVAYTGGDRHQGHEFQLTGAPVGEKDFPVGSVLRVWEFGVGDEVAVRTGVSLRRIPPQYGRGFYEVTATSPFALTMQGRAMSLSLDRETWQRIQTTQEGERVRGQVTEEMLGAGAIYLRLDP